MAEVQQLPHAESLNYWKSSTSSAQSWLDKTEALIEGFGGEVSVVAKGKQDDRVVFVMEFEFYPDRFRAVWPVLPPRGGDIKAAERQAATMLFHDVKARTLRVAVMGPRTAFLDFLLVESGMTLAQLSSAELQRGVPPLLTARAGEND